MKTKSSASKKKTSTGAKIGGIIAVILFFVLMLMPTPKGMTPEAQKSLAVFVFALIMWVAQPIPIYQTSIIGILLLPMIGAVEKQKVTFGALGYDIIWLMVAAFVLTSAINETNLGKRLALSMLTKFGKTPKGTLIALMLVNFILAFFIPSTSARAALLIPIIMILLEVYEQVPGESNFGKLITLQGVMNNHLATSMVITATSSQLLAIGFINKMTGSKLGYMDWLLGSLPQVLITGLIAFIVGYKLYHIKDLNIGGESTKEILKKQLIDLGPMTIAEKKTAIIFALTLLSWATGNYQEKLFGFSISTEQTAVISMLVCLLPKVGVIDWKQANIKWNLMIFSAGAYAIGNAFNDSGGASFIIQNFVEKIGLNTLNPNLVAVILIFITIFSHLIFTTKTVRATILIPTIITLAQSLNIDPVPLAMACSFGIAYTLTLPPHSKVNALYLSLGYFDVKDELKLGLITCFIGSVVISLLYFTYYQIIF
ncbi:permease [Finegoldia magna ALB8]|uniref:DASS family sodium-coupled anion symporter n=1 Tax=Finegoldia magna TaxID=1260 RepID=UPI00044B7AEB|nr:DASS family sodium-coupled anion symporter [Finegoldia magna]EXF27641.1 permease [Finegoldia magna ALB8]